MVVPVCPFRAVSRSWVARVAVVCLGASVAVSAWRRVRKLGRRPWKVGVSGLAGVPLALVLAGGHGRWDGVAPASLLLGRWCRCSLPAVLEEETAEGIHSPMGPRQRRLRTPSPS